MPRGGSCPLATQTPRRASSSATIPGRPGGAAAARARTYAGDRAGAAPQEARPTSTMLHPGLQPTRHCASPFPMSLYLSRKTVGCHVTSCPARRGAEFRSTCRCGRLLLRARHAPLQPPQAAPRRGRRHGARWLAPWPATARCVGAARRSPLVCFWSHGVVSIDVTLALGAPHLQAPPP